jgi:magnesium-transporting ATPase (P-type)
MEDLARAIGDSFGNISWFGVVMAAVATFAISAIWYHEKVFGKPWMKAVGLHIRDVEDASMTKIFSGSFMVMVLTAVAMDVLAQLLQVNSWREGALLGGLVGLFFVSTAMINTYLFAQRNANLVAIDTFYQIVNFITIGLIIGFWRA